MSTSPGEFGRRLSRVENDVTAMYDMIGDVQTVQGRHSAEFARIRSKLLEHDARFDAVDGRFDRIEATLAEILRRLPEAS